MDNILLSVCIPTCNREQTVLKTVKSNLKILPNNTELVVCDNGSIDNTYNLLKEIKDNKLKLYKNEKNMGFAYNFGRVIKEAKGNFVLVMSDEDYINEKEFLELLNVISKKEYLNILVSIIFNSHYRLTNLSSKEEVILNLYPWAGYLSGIVYNKTLIEENDLNFISSKLSHIELLYKLSLKGTIIFSDAEIYKLGEQAKYNEQLKNNFFSPKNRLEELKEDLSMALNINFNSKLKENILKKIFNYKIFQATLMYKSLKMAKEFKDKINFLEFDVSKLIELFKYIFLELTGGGVSFRKVCR